MSKESAGVYYVGCDDGHAEIKLAISGPDIDGVKLLKIPSRAVIGGIFTGTGGEASDRTYETEGKTYSVKSVGGDDTRTDDYHISGLNRALIHHALRRAGLGGKPVRIATSLPPGSYFLPDGSVNHARCGEKSQSLRRQVRAADGGDLARIIHSSVYAETVSAMIDLCTSNNGDVPEDIGPLLEQEGNLLTVIDVGGRTTDIVTFATVESGSGEVTLEIDHTQSGSLEAGVLHTLDNALDGFCGSHGCDRNTPSQKSISEMLVSRTLKLGGVDQDAGQFVDIAKRMVGEKIAHHVRSRVRSRQGIDMVLLVGGGAHIFADTLSGLFPMLRVPVSPEYSNARGNLRKLQNEFAVVEEGA